MLTTFFYWQLDEREAAHQDPHEEFMQQCVRLMCSFLMHLYMHPEYVQALSIMKFLKHAYKPDQTKRRWQNFMIAFMKLSSSIYCEVILIMMIA